MWMYMAADSLPLLATARERLLDTIAEPWLVTRRRVLYVEAN